MSTSNQVTLKDGTCTITLEAKKIEGTVHISLEFISPKITSKTCIKQDNKTLAFKHNFTLPDNEFFNAENLYLAILNHILHMTYDFGGMILEEENVFCEINELLEDDMQAWEQGQFYVNHKDELSFSPSVDYSITDIIRITEGKMRNVVKILLSKLN